MLSSSMSQSLNADIAGNHHALVEHAFEDIRKTFAVAGSGDDLCVCHWLFFHRKVPSGPKSRFRSSSLRPNCCFSRSISRKARRKVNPSRSISFRRQASAVDPPQGLPLQQLSDQLQQRQHQSYQAVADIFGLQPNLRRHPRPARLGWRVRPQLPIVRKERSPI